MHTSILVSIVGALIAIATVMLISTKRKERVAEFFTILLATFIAFWWTLSTEANKKRAGEKENVINVLTSVSREIELNLTVVQLKLMSFEDANIVEFYNTIYPKKISTEALEELYVSHLIHKYTSPEFSTKKVPSIVLYIKGVKDNYGDNLPYWKYNELAGNLQSFKSDLIKECNSIFEHHSCNERIEMQDYLVVSTQESRE